MKNPTPKELSDAMAVLEAYGRQSYTDPKGASRSAAIGQALAKESFHSNLNLCECFGEALEDINYHTEAAYIRAAGGIG